MKSKEGKQKTFTSVLMIIILILVMELLLIKTVNIQNNKQIIKEMTDGEYGSQITELNKSHEEYAKNVQNYKNQIATAISNQKVETLENATIDEIVTNIGKILQVGTADATATADNITKGKTAYVNGELITGTGVDNNSSYEKGKSDVAFNKVTIVTGTGNGSWTISDYISNASELELDSSNFAFQPTSILLTNSTSSTTSSGSSGYASCPSLSYSNGILTLAGCNSTVTHISYDNNERYNKETIAITGTIYCYY